MFLEHITRALGFDIPKHRKPVIRLIVFAFIGGILFTIFEFFTLYLAIPRIWASAQGPLLPLGLAPFAFAAGTAFGAISAWRD
jgi:hypothetical protein